MEIGWLIERQGTGSDGWLHNPRLYFAGLSYDDGIITARWTPDPSRAARFARQEDAAAVVPGLGVAADICEHAWG